MQDTGSDLSEFPVYTHLHSGGDGWRFGLCDVQCPAEYFQELSACLQEKSGKGNFDRGTVLRNSRDIADSYFLCGRENGTLRKCMGVYMRGMPGVFLSARALFVSSAGAV